MGGDVILGGDIERSPRGFVSSAARAMAGSFAPHRRERAWCSGAASVLGDRILSERSPRRQPD